jgi:serpin B
MKSNSLYYPLAIVLVILAMASLFVYFEKPSPQFSSPAPVPAKALTLPEVIEKVNNFTLNLYGLMLASNADKNVIVSPFNVYIALTMLYEGANSTTREELGNAMGLDNADACSAYQQLLSMLPLSSNSSAVLYVANGVWLKRGFPFREDYMDGVRRCFGGDVRSFASDINELVDEVNSWVANKTNNLIKNLLSRDDVPDNTVAILVSVIYFKGEWLKEFTPCGKIEFWRDSSSVKVDAMEVDDTHIKVARGDGYVAVEIPYKNTTISMVIIMPGNFSKAIKSYRDLILNALSKLDNTKPGTLIHLIMPKFNITFRRNLNDDLKKLGIREVFTGNADLSRMAYVSRGDIYVDKVVHQAIIKVYEKGTEAAAATAIIIATAAFAYPEEVIINKPFIYMLRDSQNKAILFIGHFIDPSQMN